MRYIDKFINDNLVRMGNILKTHCELCRTELGKDGICCNILCKMYYPPYNVPQYANSYVFFNR